MVEGEAVNDLGFWNSLVFEAYQNGNAEESFGVFKRMRMERTKPYSVTVINFVEIHRGFEVIEGMKSYSLFGCCRQPV